MKQGLVYIFTGEGKGKTSAALGVATRSLLNGEKVAWISFYKQDSWGLSEAKLKEKFKNLEMIFVGKGFRIVNSEQKISTVEGKEIKLATVGESNKVIDTASEEEHIAAAKEGLEIVRQKILGKPFLLVMDEVLNAVSEGLLTQKDVMKVVEQRGEINVVMTGRSENDSVKTLLSKADLVTECLKIKHPYDNGQLAVKGLDF